MKKIFLSLCIALVSVCSYAQQGTTAAGVYGAFGSENSNFGLGAKVQYGILDALRAEASFDYFFKKDYLTNMNASLNVHYLIPISEKFRVYPLAVVSYIYWKADYEGAVDDALGGYGDLIPDEMKDELYGDVDDSESKIGFNLGAGVEYDLTDKLSIFAEGRYQFVSDFDQAVIGVGLTYKF